MDDDPAYYGHFANDGAGYLALEICTAPSLAIEMGLEERIAEYVSESEDLANAAHKPLEGGGHILTVATKDIKAGEEIMVTYGPEYWLEFS